MPGKSGARGFEQGGGCTCNALGRMAGTGGGCGMCCLPGRLAGRSRRLPAARLHPPGPTYASLLCCREAAQLARALSGLHGGLPALLAATADEAPAAQAQLVPSAAAIASTLFVAANEFAAEQEEDAAVSAELLLAGELACRSADPSVADVQRLRVFGACCASLLSRPCVAFPPEACVLVPLRCRCVSHPPPRSEALPRPSAFAPTLLAVATEAGCPNLAVALALLLGDQPALQRFAGRHPEVWADLHGLLANDVHLCGYAPMLSPLPSPVVRTGSLPVGALLAA